MPTQSLHTGAGLSEDATGCRHRGTDTVCQIRCTHEIMEGGGQITGLSGPRQDTTAGQEKGREPRVSWSLAPGVPGPGRPPKTPSSALATSPSEEPRSPPGLQPAGDRHGHSWPQEEFLEGQGCQMEKRQSGLSHLGWHRWLRTHWQGGLRKPEPACSLGPFRPPRLTWIRSEWATTSRSD